MVDLINNVLSPLEKGASGLTTFINLSKAFNTVSHPLLLQMEDFLRGLYLQLFQNYLSNRHQNVRVENVCSDKLLIAHAVPQGMVLDPKLFSIYLYT